MKHHQKTEYKLLMGLSVENQVLSKPAETILGHFKEQPNPNPKWSKSSEKWKDLTKSLAKWFCKISRSTAMVEDEGFAAFLALACPSYELPSRRTLSKYIEELYQKEHKRVKTSLENIEFCAITTDGGTSSNTTSFQIFYLLGEG